MLFEVTPMSIEPYLKDRFQAFTHARMFRAAVSLEEYVIGGFLAIVLFGIGLAIAAPQVNGLTTGTTPIIGATSTNGTVLPFVITFFIIGVMLALIGGALAIYKQHT